MGCAYCQSVMSRTAFSCRIFTLQRLAELLPECHSNEWDTGHHDLSGPWRNTAALDTQSCDWTGGEMGSVEVPCCLSTRPCIVVDEGHSLWSVSIHYSRAYSSVEKWHTLPFIW